jgi:flagellar motility protein MotE (MotC chaperone)
MYAIYDARPEQLSLFEDEKEELLDLNEAEEILRQLRSENPAEYERITQLRDGIRSARDSAQKGMFVFCQMGRFQQLFLIDSQGNVSSKDLPRVLGAIKCGADERTSQLPSNYNSSLMRIKSQFAEEAKHRRAELEHTVSLTHGQRYVLRELGVFFRTAEDEELKAQINILEKAFRSTRLSHAIKRELNLLRKNTVIGPNLMKELVRIYQQHNMREAVERPVLRSEDRPVPQIICSEALV